MNLLVNDKIYIPYSCSIESEFEEILVDSTNFYGIVNLPIKID